QSPTYTADDGRRCLWSRRTGYRRIRTGCCRAVRTDRVRPDLRTKPRPDGGVLRPSITPPRFRERGFYSCIMSGEELTTHVDGIVHEETQITERGLDLTIGEIHEVAEPGRVDFGGGELEAADTAPLETEKRDPDDDYGWWNLDAGGYLVA